MRTDRDASAVSAIATASNATPATTNADAAPDAGALGFFNGLLEEARATLVSFEPERIERLETSCRMLAQQNLSHALSRGEAILLASRCRSLDYLLRHTASNLCIVRKLSSARASTACHAPAPSYENPTHTTVHRGYPWLR